MRLDAGMIVFLSWSNLFGEWRNHIGRKEDAKKINLCLYVGFYMKK